MIRAFSDGKERVWCDNCGDELDFGGWFREEWVYEGNARIGFCTITDEHYCDECMQDVKPAHEFRICNHCGKPFDCGFTDLDGFYSCEECFEEAMTETFGEWRKAHYEGYNGGYYDAYEPRECEWYDTGVFYTEWW